MRETLTQLSQQARFSVQRRDWASVAILAKKIQKNYKKEPEGYFLGGLKEKANGKTNSAILAFNRALKLDSRRYDAAIELSHQYLLSLLHNEAFDLLCRYEQQLSNSPLYLDMAAKIFSGLGLHSRAWPLFQKANQLQPDLDMFQANLAACGVLLGKAKEAKSIYLSLLSKYPQHQQNHYQLSKLERAENSDHVEQMQKVLEENKQAPEKNIFMYYAIGKELEDLGRWKESFQYYKLAGEAILNTTDYDVADDINFIEQIIKVCNVEWLAETKPSRNVKIHDKTPIFIVGLPRTGTTLTERIVSSHSQVESADETFFMQMAIRHVSRAGGIDEINEKILKKAATKDIDQIAQKYLSSVSYRLTDRPMFIDKYPYNYLHLGFISKAFPDAKIIYLKRNPMDACFAMYKQSFFKFAYSLEHLGRYYVAQDRLRQHWKKIMGDRLIEIDYESLVNDQEGQTRGILEKLGLDFEENCMNFENNEAASASASTLQVREKVHTRSLNKWKHFAEELQPLQDYLTASGISTD